MTFADDIDSALVELRAFAEDRMRDTWLFERATGETVLDPETDADVPLFDAIHETRGRLTGIDNQARESQAGARTTVSAEPTLHTPVEATPKILPGDRVRCTAVGAMSDPALLDVVLEVVATPVGSQKTARRWPVRRWEA